MASHLHLELTSPQKVAFNKPVAMVTVPASQGAYSVLPGHAPMITDVAPGLVEVYEEDGSRISSRLFVTGGYCEVTTERCSVMADEILDPQSFVHATVQKEIDDLIQARCDLGPEDSDTEIEAKLAIAMAKHQFIVAQ